MNIFTSYVSICACVVAGIAFAVESSAVPEREYEAASFTLPLFPNLSYPQPEGEWGCKFYKTCSDKS